jgi:hypothetical protein
MTTHGAIASLPDPSQSQRKKPVSCHGKPSPCLSGSPIMRLPLTSLVGKTTKSNKRNPSIGVPKTTSPETSKPRPYVCKICSRSFTRLEHVGRHERSHTKEKPFKCQTCTRCFARMDLLLRHQRTLHMTKPTSSKLHAGARASTISATDANNKVRKPTVANSSREEQLLEMAAEPSRPRANAIRHVDLLHSSFVGKTKANASGPLYKMDDHGSELRHGYADSTLDTRSGVSLDYLNLPASVHQHRKLVDDLYQINTLALDNMDLDDSFLIPSVMDEFCNANLDQLFSPETIPTPAQPHPGGATLNPRHSIVLPLASTSAGAKPTFDELDETEQKPEWDMNMMVDNRSAANSGTAVLRLDNLSWSRRALMDPRLDNPRWLQQVLLSQHAAQVLSLETNALGSSSCKTTTSMATVSPAHSTAYTPGTDCRHDDVTIQQDYPSHHTSTPYPGTVLEQDVGHETYLRSFPQPISTFRSNSLRCERRAAKPGEIVADPIMIQTGKQCTGHEY